MPKDRAKMSAYKLTETIAYAERDMKITVLSPQGKSSVVILLNGSFWSHDRFEAGSEVMLLIDDHSESPDLPQAEAILEAQFFVSLLHDTPTEFEAWFKELLAMDLHLQQAVLGHIGVLRGKGQSRSVRRKNHFDRWRDAVRYFRFIEPYLDGHSAAMIQSWIDRSRVNAKENNHQEDKRSQEKLLYYFNCIPQFPCLPHAYDDVLASLKSSFSPQPEFDEMLRQVAFAFANAERSRAVCLVGPGQTLMRRLIDSVAYALRLEPMTFRVGGYTSSSSVDGNDSAYWNSGPGEIITGFAQAKADPSDTLLTLVDVDQLPDEGTDRGRDGQVVEHLSQLVASRAVQSAFLDGVPIPLDYTHMILTASSVHKIPKSLRCLCQVVTFPEIDQALTVKLLKAWRLADVTRTSGLPDGWTDEAVLSEIARHRNDLGLDNAEQLLMHLAAHAAANERHRIERPEAEAWLSAHIKSDDAVIRFHQNEDRYPEWQRKAIRDTISSMQWSDASDVESRARRLRLAYLTQLIPPRDVPAFDPKRFVQEAGCVVGLDDVKQRLAALLAAGEVPLLVSPPGVGKTTLARAVARAVGRPFIEINLMGKTTHELCGVGPETIGGDGGIILREEARAGTTAPVIFFDEADKALPECQQVLIDLLDNSKPRSVYNHFLQMNVPLQDAMILVAANSTELHPALLSRCQIIELRAYTIHEKARILRSVLKEESVRITEQLQMALVQRSVLEEAGVRELKHHVREIKGRLLLGEQEDESLLRDMHLPYLYKADGTRPGQVNGLAVTGQGAGMILPVQCTLLAPEARSCTVTGLAREEIRDSVALAQMWLRRQIGREQNFHIHFLPGGIEKAGPSCGLALAVAMYSAAMQEPVDAAYCFTGELGGGGEVLPVSGLAEKLNAAAVGGCRIAFLPEACRRDVPDPAVHFPELEVVFVSAADAVIERIFVQNPERRTFAAFHSEKEGADAGRPYLTNPA